MRPHGSRGRHDEDGVDGDDERDTTWVWTCHDIREEEEKASRLWEEEGRLAGLQRGLQHPRRSLPRRASRGAPGRMATAAHVRGTSALGEEEHRQSKVAYVIH
jgi:hypothetical protein